MQRKSSLIGEAVERISVSVACGGGIVLALVEEGAGLLPGESIEVEADSVHGEDGAGPLAAHQLRLARRQLLQFANVGIDALDDAGLGIVLSDGVEDRLPQVLAIESLGQRLHGKHIVVLVEDEPGQQVGLAEDHAVGIGVARDLLAKANCGSNALPQQSRASCASRFRRQSAGESQSAMHCCRALNPDCRPRSSRTCTSEPAGASAGGTRSER